MQQFRQAIANLNNRSVEGALLTMTDAASGDAAKLREQIEAWFNSSMDRVSGWYKRRAQWILFAIGFIVALGGGVNTIDIAQKLSRDPKVREALVNQALQTRQSPTDDQLAQQVKSIDETVGLTLGTPTFTRWRKPAGASGGEEEWQGSQIWFDVLGCFITACAVSLGAPFWFDTLNKFILVRSTVKPAEKSAPEPSKG